MIKTMLFILMCGISIFAQKAGQVGGNAGFTQDQAVQSMSDWYSEHDIVIANIGGTFYSVSDSFPGEYIKCFVNMTADTGVIQYLPLKDIADTTKKRIYPLTAQGASTIKLPPISRIYKSGSTVVKVKAMTQKISAIAR